MKKFSDLVDPLEITQCLGLGDEMVCHFQNIDGIIEHQFLKFFGKGMRDKLLGALAEYPSVKPWDPETPTVVGEYVHRCGKIYKVIKASECKKPPNIEYYECAKKFKEEGCCDWEDLWCNYICPFLSYCVGIVRLPRIQAQLKANGLVVMNSDKLKGASNEAQKAFNGSYETEFNIYKELLIGRAKDNPSCFVGCPFLQTEKPCQVCHSNPCGCGSKQKSYSSCGCEESCGCGTGYFDHEETIDDGYGHAF